MLLCPRWDLPLPFTWFLMSYKKSTGLRKPKFRSRSRPKGSDFWNRTWKGKGRINEIDILYLLKENIPCTLSNRVLYSVRFLYLFVELFLFSQFYLSTDYKYQPRFIFDPVKLKTFNTVLVGSERYYETLVTVVLLTLTVNFLLLQVFSFPLEIKNIS